ncbi:hypothetical protein BD289DRAFT_277005 [Coniella lustricola]|uniref:Anp1-domain-containing protein n=1 Tax=Coniella lustricola TaxID=2025994 RepID=A0A2T3A6D2_9PEZI|nr:hypothetical protein BD289DRAFT_277005 [Coniella lustricola]
MGVLSVERGQDRWIHARSRPRAVRTIFLGLLLVFGLHMILWRQHNHSIHQRRIPISQDREWCRLEHNASSHEPALPVRAAEPKAYSTDFWSTSDGRIQHYTLVRPTTVPPPEQAVLILSVTRDEESFGRNPTEAPRTFRNYLDFITTSTPPETQISLAVLTSSATEFAKYVHILTPPNDESSQESELRSAHTIRRNRTADYFDFDFHRVTLILHTVDTRPDDKSQYDSVRALRHGMPQHDRRAHIAKLRNYLQTTALHQETHLLWLDADVYKFSSPTMVETMMKRTTTSPTRDVGILTARCAIGEHDLAEAWLSEHPDFILPAAPQPGDDEESVKTKLEMRGAPGGRYEILAHKTNAQESYDLNAWIGRRYTPNNIEQEMLWEDKASWEPSHALGRTLMVHDAIRGTADDDLVRLDAVGGTLLMIRADLVRMGLIFTPGYFVGMTWEHGEGYDGIETEGICVMSRSFSRDGKSSCYAMGGDWAVYHTIW